MKTRNTLFAALASLSVLVSCSDDFLTRPPEDTLLDLNFYKTDAQVLAATAPLYSAVWKDYIDKANFKIGDMRGGSVYRAYNDRDHVLFNTTAVSLDSRDAYRAFYVVVGQANLVLFNIKNYGGAGLSEAIKNHARAEARFMRATAYTHLVMNYGAVPIIEDNIAILADAHLKRNDEASVWEFILRDYLFAAANLTEEPVAEGRLTKWSAEGMLARTYLTLANFYSAGGARKQEFLDKAKEFSDRVITQSGKSLLPVYEDLFKYPYDNNDESLFELQWVFSTAQNGYAYTNTMVSQITYNSAIAANGDGWGGDVSASWWMLSLYDSLMLHNGSAGFTLDKRLKSTFMLPGFTYEEISQTSGVDAAGNETYVDLVFGQPAAADQSSFASIKKYVVGKARDVGGQAARQAYPNNTYMMRLAEMYYIYVEAELGNAESTTDAKALDYFNAVRARTGLTAFVPAVTPDDDPRTNDELSTDFLFRERTKEFAMESMLWYDLVRLHYSDPTKAINLINAQDRGLFLIRPDRWPDPTAWTFTKTSWATERNATAAEGNFLIPLPASEVSQAPELAEEPVPYDFKE